MAIYISYVRDNLSDLELLELEYSYADKGYLRVDDDERGGYVVFARQAGKFDFLG